MLKSCKFILGMSLATAPLLPVQAETLYVAVASNFAHTMRTLATDFERTTDNKISLSSASTGKLYAQIINGAPFDVFLAADKRRPELLIEKGLAEEKYSRIYASGKLVLLSNIAADGNCISVLDNAQLRRLAIANPNTAPYGVAALQVLKRLNKWGELQTKLVMGENIAQALQFVATGNATAGFVAESLLLNRTIKHACRWDVPTEFHEPINQKMVIISAVNNKPDKAALAHDFWQYMQSENAMKIIRDNGYDVH